MRIEFTSVAWEAPTLSFYDVRSIASSSTQSCGADSIIMVEARRPPDAGSSALLPSCRPDTPMRSPHPFGSLTRLSHC